MSNQNNEALATTQYNFIIPQVMQSEFTAAELAEDMDGLQLRFKQIKIPAGGSLQFEIPTDDPDNPDYARTVEGVILYNHFYYAYWPESEDGEDDENSPPQCQSMDGKLGIGNPSGLCVNCGFNRFGSRGKAKACKNMRVLYLLRSGEILPIQISLPPTSLRAFNDFANYAFLLRNRGLCSAVVQIGLKKETNGKDEYSVATFKKLYDFEGEDLAQIRAYADQFREQAKVMLSQRASQAETESGDVEVGTVPKNLPGNAEHFSIGVIDGERELLPA